MTAGLPRQAEAHDLPELVALLAECALPFGDLTETHLREFLVCRDGGRLVATAGLELCDDAVLLRSLAVAATHRGRGLATRLVDALERRARAKRQRVMFLLTKTVPGFFAARGFRPVERQLVPAAIATTTEFRSLCPASALCMRKRLDGEAPP
ncbi:arsenic resistance N-acetyltransferase ArsN2 [Accumulibacter sp.]|uniref:GCN5-related N-acetyltransferase n=1 Tax=Accumulibacter regalis TaxID=522306 RepID=C7RNF0_ACCRE|nr:arsenic resistance N-acetyltransferase ArsN2 [Accumulibacter sp.]MBN8498986.1 GNAT family N-acetyltransferase [Accumulibacter sp.]MBO3717279.1 GNAT family N-acetyltransferase [Accumulibacter sp.]